MRLFHLVGALALTSVAHASARAQGRPDSAAAPALLRTVSASRLSGDIRLDGRLDDASWMRADSTGGFVQSWPSAGSPATERTIVRVLYDDNALYVDVRAYDAHPDSIAAQLARRDATGIYSDWLHLMVDSYHDRRTAFFGAMLSGAGLWGVVRAAPTSSWPSTSGVIERSRVASVGRDGPDEPDLLYVYTIEGRRYTGSRIGYAMFLTDGATRRLASRYPVGAAVRVFHDRRRPDRAVLEPGGARRAARCARADHGRRHARVLATGRSESRSIAQIR